MEIDLILERFIKAYTPGIKNIHNKYYADHNKLAFPAFLEEVKPELINGYNSFIKNHNGEKGLDQYLFYIVNAYAKTHSKCKEKKIVEYLCPGCLSLGKDNIIFSFNNILKCDECSSLKEENSNKANLYKAFSLHSKNGYKCPSCNRFIPHSSYDGISRIMCPYIDCCFVGHIDGLKRMHHPNISKAPSFSDIDTACHNGSSIPYKLRHTSFVQAKPQVSNQDLKYKVQTILDIINNQSDSVAYCSCDFTLMHKINVYKAYKNILCKYPLEMVDYLLYESRSGGFQHKVFQEYIRLIEKSFPFTYTKGKTIYKVDSLLDSNLNIFDGISTFEGIINSNLEIKNGTKEIYIGGKKANIVRPYYIGKLLNIVNGKDILIPNVKEYSFSKIKMVDVKADTKVIVTHLRVVPHYQMGSMAYINKIRKKIVDRAMDVLKDEL